MKEVFEILKYVLPSLVVFVTAYYMLQQLMKNEQEKRSKEVVMGNQKIITPIRLQAYERVALFLERISPDALIVRVNKPKMTVKDLQENLVFNIRREFEHNLSQQIYMTPDAWEVIVNAKESIIQLINVAAQRIKPDAPALELSKTIIQMTMNAPETPVKKALRFIKDETHHFMENKPLYYPERIRG